MIFVFCMYVHIFIDWNPAAVALWATGGAAAAGAGAGSYHQVSNNLVMSYLIKLSYWSGCRERQWTGQLARS